MSAVVLDGATYVAIAFFGALAAGFATVEAAKYIAPIALFWVRLCCGTMSASLLALKMFRSTSYAEAQAKKNGNGNSHALGPAAPPPAPGP